MRGRREEGQEDQEDQLNEAVWQEKQAEKEGGIWQRRRHGQYLGDAR